MLLAILHRFQPLIIPAVLVLTAWATTVTIFKKDTAVGFVLYLSIIIVVDSYLNTGIYIPGLRYGSIRYSEVIYIFLFARAPQKITQSGLPQFIDRLIALYFILFFYAALRGLTVTDGLNTFRAAIVPQILAFWIGRRGFRAIGDYHRCFSYLILLLILVGLFTVWDVFFDTILLHSDSINAPDYYVNRANDRFGSFFLNPIDLGDFAVLVLPVMLLTTRAQQTTLRRVVCWGGILLFMFAFVKTQSRGAMIGFAAALMVFVLLPYRHFPVYRRGISIVMVSVLLALFMPGFFETATRRFENMENESSMEEVDRASTWDHVIQNVIPSHPVFGVGLGEARFIQTMAETGYQEKFGKTLDNAHSSYLAIAVAAGLPALLIFLMVNGLVIMKNVAFMRRTVEKELGLLLLGLTCGIVGFLVATTSGQDMFRASVAPAYWLIIGLCLSIINRYSGPQADDGRRGGTESGEGILVSPGGDDDVRAVAGQRDQETAADRARRRSVPFAPRLRSVAGPPI